MRFYLLLLLATLVFTLPYAMDQFMVPDPAAMRLVLLLPSECLHYAAVIVHELSHTAADIFFGYPAFPTFDYTHGGGTTFRWPQNYLLVVAVDALLMGSAGLALRFRKRPLAGGMVSLAAFQLAVLLAGIEDSIVIFMGHGGEILAASLILLRAARITSPFERAFALVFAGHLYLRVILLATALLLSPARRASYALQKGIPNSGDIGKLAGLWHTSVTVPAAVMLVYTLVAVAASCFCIYKSARLREAEAA